MFLNQVVSSSGFLGIVTSCNYARSRFLVILKSVERWRHTTEDTREPLFSFNVSLHLIKTKVSLTPHSRHGMIVDI